MAINGEFRALKIKKWLVLFILLIWVALESKINGHSVRCGGSLIKVDQVLTAAFCVYNATTTTITLGAHNLEEKEDTQVTLESSNYTIHEEYNWTSHTNDIAIIRLGQSVNLTSAISTIETPPLKDILLTYDDDLGLVAGWGKYSDVESIYSNVLRKIEVTIIPYLACTISYLFKVQQTEMCTTGLQNSKNICLGDSGSPLVVNGTQVGIASYGSDFGCSVGAPAVHTRLTRFASWLSQNVQ
ncbi:hypothetical protein ABEB36_002336 [Hypothenemus hampei]|uniref:Peptidase S1 domain-containing protein n=1 Tax=Hypothenemus hampei TaxID=57062 RepID=A0ABD1F8H8_HYPHA